MVPVHQTGRVLTKACRGVESGEWREGEKANKGACQKGLRHRQATRDAHSTGGGEEEEEYRQQGTHAPSRKDGLVASLAALPPRRCAGCASIITVFIKLNDCKESALCVDTAP